MSKTCIKITFFFSVSIAVIFYALGQGLHSFSSVWLSFWSDYNQNHTSPEIRGKLGFYLGIYAGVGGFEAVIEFTRDMVLFLLCARASKRLHQRLLHSVMRSPMSFFDTNPTGRIVNRFSADIDKIGKFLVRFQGDMYLSRKILHI